MATRIWFPLAQLHLGEKHQKWGRECKPYSESFPLPVVMRKEAKPCQSFPRFTMFFFHMVRCFTATVAVSLNTSTSWYEVYLRTQTQSICQIVLVLYTLTGPKCVAWTRQHHYYRISKGLQGSNVSEGSSWNMDKIEKTLIGNTRLKVWRVKQLLPLSPLDLITKCLKVK